MSKVSMSIIALVIIIGALVGVGLYQNSQNDPLNGCTKYDASDSMNGYACQNGTTLYTQK